MITLTAYAKRRGCSVKAVSKAVAAGRLVDSVVRDDRGQPKIGDPDLADREWAANTRGPVPAPSAIGARAAEPQAGPASPAAVAANDLNASRALRAAAGARREVAMADMAELELAERRGDLVHAEEARAAVIAKYSLVKTRLLGVPTRLAQRVPHLAAEVVPIVEELVREALEELAGP